MHNGIFRSGLLSTLFTTFIATAVSSSGDGGSWVCHNTSGCPYGPEDCCNATLDGDLSTENGWWGNQNSRSDAWVAYKYDGGVTQLREVCLWWAHDDDYVYYGANSLRVDVSSDGTNWIEGQSWTNETHSKETCHLLDSYITSEYVRLYFTDMHEAWFGVMETDLIKDVDYCRGDPCGIRASCTVVKATSNESGTYTCSCDSKNGFIGEDTAGMAATCVDVHGCVEDSCGTDAGSWVCDGTSGCPYGAADCCDASIDGDLSADNGWWGNDNSRSDAWVTYKYDGYIDGVTQLREICLWWAHDDDYAYGAKTVRVDTSSDGTNWAEGQSWTNQTASTDELQLCLLLEPYITSEYVRLNFTDMLDYWFGVMEMDLRRDVDYCRGDPCGTSASCTVLKATSNGPGNYTCSCDIMNGFIGEDTVGMAPTCTDIDGCADNPCGSDASCTDVPAKYVGSMINTTLAHICSCDDGYFGEVTGGMEATCTVCGGGTATCTSDQYLDTSTCDSTSGNGVCTDKIKVAFISGDGDDDCWVDLVFPQLDPEIFSSVDVFDPATNERTAQELAHEYDVIFLSGDDYGNTDAFALLEDLLVNYNQAVFSTAWNVEDEDPIFNKYMNPFKEDAFYDYNYFYCAEDQSDSDFDSLDMQLHVDNSLDLRLRDTSTYNGSRYPDLPTYKEFVWNCSLDRGQERGYHQYQDYEYCNTGEGDCKRPGWEWVLTANFNEEQVPVLAYSRLNGGIASYSALDYCYDVESEGTVWYALAQNIIISLAELSTGGHTCLASQSIDPQTQDMCGNGETCTDIIVGTAGGYHLRHGNCSWHIATPGAVLDGSISAVIFDIAASASLELEITYFDQSRQTFEFTSSGDVFELKEALSVELRFMSNEDTSVLGKQASFEEGFALTLQTTWRECTCEGGMAAKGADCLVHGDEFCTSCDGLLELTSENTCEGTDVAACVELNKGECKNMNGCSYSYSGLSKSECKKKGWCDHKKKFCSSTDDECVGLSKSKCKHAFFQNVYACGFTYSGLSKRDCKKKDWCDHTHKYCSAL